MNSARFKQPLTIAEAVHLITADQLLLPGIQRSFVWQQKKITTLFDSLMRGYPLGSVLAWRTRPIDHKHLRFRPVVTHFDGTNSLSKPASPVNTAWIHAILDGQQRLTAFNIGLRGSYASAPGKQASELFLDLNAPAEDPGAEQDQYTFEFRVPKRQANGTWFRVVDAVGLARDGTSLNHALEAAEIARTVQHRRTLARLSQALNADRVLRVDVEHTPDLDRVLNIFARTNTGGTKLTYVDLLVSTATVRWKSLDAKASFEGLRSEMNAMGEGFRFTSERLVKASLVLLDASETQFHVKGFTTGNRARRLEDEWPAFREAMLTATKTLASFGLSSTTLAAENVIIPIAYYAWHRELKTSYATAHSHDRDRQRVRAFVARTLLQRRYWTGAIDPVLVATRSAIRAHGAASFPLKEIEAALFETKPITVSHALIDELSRIEYGDRRALLLLRLLFPEVTRATSFDKDHIFPMSRFRSEQLQRDGMPPQDLLRLCLLANRLPNLQLLDAVDNQGGGKSAKMPKEWLQGLTPTARKRYSAQFVKYLPADLAGFEDFWERRRSQLAERIAALLAG